MFWLQLKKVDFNLFPGGVQYLRFYILAGGSLPLRGYVLACGCAHTPLPPPPGGGLDNEASMIDVVHFPKKGDIVIGYSTI